MCTKSADAAGSIATAYTLSIGDIVQGALTPSDHDFYRINLVAGQTYTFSLVGTGVNNVRDTVLEALRLGRFAEF